MYAFIKGKVVELTPTYVVLLTSGIGYFINISLNTYGKIKGTEEIKLFTHLVVREDDMQLYGFADEDERSVFRELISVSGVGVNTARIILSSLSITEIHDAITHEKVAVLQSVKGIGSKSAQRIILDLKDRLSKQQFSGEILQTAHNTNREAALSGLIMLGFNKRLTEKALDKIINSPDLIHGKDGNDLTVEELIKEALKLL